MGITVISQISTEYAHCVVEALYDDTDDIVSAAQFTQVIETSEELEFLQQSVISSVD